MSIGTEASSPVADGQVTDGQEVVSSEESGTEVADQSVEGTEAPSGDAPEDSLEDSEEPASSDAEEPAEEFSPPEWITDELREVGSSYGLSDEDIGAFDGATAFQRACRLVDRQLAASQPAEDPPAEPTEEPAPEPAKTLAPPEEPSAEPSEDDLTLDMSNYDGWDEDTLRIVKAAKRLQEENQQLRSEMSTGLSEFGEQLGAIQREREEEKHQAELSAFHEVVDGMDKELFGGDGKLTEEADARRKDLWESYNTVRAAAVRSAVANGRPPKVPPMRAMVTRASLLAFGDQIIEQNRKEVHRSIHEQSRKRRPAPSKGKVLRAPPTKADPQNIREAARQIANDPETVALFDRLTEEHGNEPQ